MRLCFGFAALAVSLAAVACSLSPQPLPPEASNGGNNKTGPDASVNLGAGTDGGTANPPPSTPDAGTFADGGPAIDGAAADAGHLGDAATDAPSDAPTDALEEGG